MYLVLRSGCILSSMHDELYNRFEVLCDPQLQIEYFDSFNFRREGVNHYHILSNYTDAVLLEFSIEERIVHGISYFISEDVVEYIKLKCI